MFRNGGPAAAGFAVVAWILVVLFSPRVGIAQEVTALRPLIQAGEKAPTFTLNGLDGKPYAFVPGKGKSSLLIFWSCFCPLCRELTPDLSELFRRHGKTVRFLSINLDGKRFSNSVSSFVKENRMEFPVLLDDIRNDFFIASDPYGISKTPTAVFIDDNGVVRGAFAAEAIREMIRDFDQVSSSPRK